LGLARRISRCVRGGLAGCSLAAVMCGATCGGTLWAQATGPVSLPDGVHLRLEVKDGKTSFKMGEPIDLDLTVSGDNPGYEVGAWDGDHIVLMPTAGTLRWRGLFSSDAVQSTALTTQGSTFTSRLNDQYQIKEPGTYAVSMDTWRVMKKPTMPTGMLQSTENISNTVTFELLSMSEEDEAARVKLLSGKVQGAATPDDAKKAWDELAYLTGDVAAREKVRLYLAGRNGELAKFPGSDEQADRLGDVEKALALSKNKQLEIELLHPAWQDVRSVPDEGLLNSMTELARLDTGIGIPDSCGMCAMPRTKWDDVQALEKPYIDEIVATMPERKGENRKQAGWFLYQKLLHLPASAGFEEARKTVIENFENDSVEEQEAVMECNYNHGAPAILRDPAIIPVVERIVRTAKPDEEDSDPCALARLVEIAPERAVPYFVEAVSDPDSELSLREFGGLKEAVLPQLDKVLLGQIQTSAAKAAKDLDGVVSRELMAEVIGARSSLNDRTLLAARYASPAIFAPMLALYRQYSAKWELDQRGAVLAYLLRWDAAKTMPLLRTAMTVDDSPFSGALATIGKIYSYIPKPFPPELRADLVEKVAHGSYKDVMTAAMELSMHGLPEDEPVLKKRLAAVEAELKLHPEKLDESPSWGTAAGPMSAESALIGALRTDKVWHPTESELTALKLDCLGAMCKELTATATLVPPGY
jgi:hypothetical protein